MTSLGYTAVSKIKHGMGVGEVAPWNKLLVVNEFHNWTDISLSRKAQ